MRLKWGMAVGYLVAGLLFGIGCGYALEEAVEDRSGDVVYLDRDPRLDRLRDDRRFSRLRRTIGLP